MRKLAVRPTQARYTARRSISPYESTQLEGGEGRYTRAILGVTRLVDCQWIMGAGDYEYLCSFIRSFENNPVPFEVDLILEDSLVSTYTAWFVKDSYILPAEIKGNGHYVTAQLEVRVPLTDPQLDDDILDIREELGPDWRLWLDRLHVIVNSDIPRSMP